MKNSSEYRKKRNLRSTLVEPFKQIKIGIYVMVISMAFLVDTSGSMEIAGKLDHAKKAIRSIVQARLPGDAFALFVFSEGKVEMAADFSSDSAKLFRALDALE